jgi:hypothetical protein
MADEDSGGLKDRLTRQGEDALGKLASDLLENPLINSAITRAFSARERAVHAQEAAMGALNIPSAADIDKLTRRLRTVAGRLEGVEDGLDRLQRGVDGLDERLQSVSRGSEPGVADRLASVEGQLTKLVAEVGTISAALDARPAPVPREQERLAMDEAPPKAKPARGQSAKK